MNNTSQADDAAQEIFIKIYQSLNKFKAKSSFSTWIYRITVNHCHDILRKRSSEQSDSWEELIEKEGEKIENLLISPASSNLSKEESELVRTLLASISDRYRHILILREIDNLSYQEISETLDCSIDSVKAKLRRARQEMQEKVRHLLKASPV